MEGILLGSGFKVYTAASAGPTSRMPATDVLRLLAQASVEIARQQPGSAALNFLAKARRDPRALAAWIDFIGRHFAEHANSRPNSRILRKPQRNYGMSGRSVEQRVGALIAHYQFAARVLPPNLYAPLLDNQPVELARLTAKDRSFTVSLASSLGHEQKQEGEFTIFVSDDEALVLVRMAFSFGCSAGGQPQILIGGLQGLSAGIDKSHIVRATRELSGLRPKDAALVAVHALAEALGVETVLAVSQATHVLATEWAFSGSYISRDYDGFWRERGGIEAPGIGYILSRHDYVARVAATQSPRIADKHRATLTERVKAKLRQTP